MAINIVGGPGKTTFSSADFESMPIQQLTMIVMAQVMMVKEGSQRQQVEELAAKNALVKRYNDALSSAARLAEAFGSKAEPGDRRDVSGDHQAITWDAMNDWNHICQGDFQGKDGPKGSVLVPDESGKLVEVKLEGLTFEQRLDLLSTKSVPPMTDKAKDMLRGRAQLADIAQAYGMLDGGLQSKGTSYVNVAHGDLSKGTLDTLKTKLKTAAEALGSENQLDMIKLQEVISRVGSITSALTSFVNSSAQTQKEVAQKM